MVLSAISPKADYIYTYCEGAKQELKIFTKLSAEDDEFCNDVIELLDKKYNEDSKTNKDFLMWNFDFH